MHSPRHMLRSTMSCRFREITRTATTSFAGRFGSVAAFAGCSGLAAYVALQASPSVCNPGDYAEGGVPTHQLFLRLRKKTDFNLKEIERLYLEFNKEIDRLGFNEARAKHDFRISPERFANFFHARLNLDYTHMISLFRCFNKDEQPSINLEEFVIGASKLCRGNTANKIG